MIIIYNTLYTISHLKLLNKIESKITNLKNNRKLYINYKESKIVVKSIFLNEFFFFINNGFIRFEKSFHVISGE